MMENLDTIIEIAAVLLSAFGVRFWVGREQTKSRVEFYARVAAEVIDQVDDLIDPASAVRLERWRGRFVRLLEAAGIKVNAQNLALGTQVFERVIDLHNDKVKLARVDPARRVVSLLRGD